MKQLETKQAIHQKKPRVIEKDTIRIQLNAATKVATAQLIQEKMQIYFLKINEKRKKERQQKMKGRDLISWPINI